MSEAPTKIKPRPIDGIVLLDKPSGISSNSALQKVKRLFNAEKAGHTGSLDPLASGMLPICLGEATKFSQYLLDADKQYLVTAALGIKTASGDSEGEIIAQREVRPIAKTELLQILKQFTGAISQVPPMFSALKYQGQPLYKLARRGIEIERTPRQVHIYGLELLQFDGVTVVLKVHCSKGTYIRTLIDDLGDALGCGAHITALRRLATANFQPEQMMSLEVLQKLQAEAGYTALDQKLLPIDSALNALPAVLLSAMTTSAIKHGQAVFIPRAPTSGAVRLVSQLEGFMGLGKVLDDGRIAPCRLLKQST